MNLKNFPLRAAYKVLRVPSDSLPLFSAPSARFDHRHKGPHFANLSLGLKSLSAAMRLGISRLQLLNQFSSIKPIQLHDIQRIFDQKYNRTMHNNLVTIETLEQYRPITIEVTLRVT